MTFTLEIELGNDAMERSDDVRRALKELHRHLGDQWIRGQLLNREDGGKIMDVNGNSVGKWEVSESIEVREDIQQDSIATLLWDYLKRDPEHKDRRQTGYGTKTKQGLYLSIGNILKQTGGLR